jgi:hypothetical protein
VAALHPSDSWDSVTRDGTPRGDVPVSTWSALQSSALQKESRPTHPMRQLLGRALRFGGGRRILVDQWVNYSLPAGHRTGLIGPPRSGAATRSHEGGSR